MSITPTEATAAKADYKATSDANLAMFNSQIDALVTGVPPVTGESAQGTTVTATNGATITDSNGDKWTLKFYTPWNTSLVYKNGKNTNDDHADELRYCEHTVYAINNQTPDYVWKITATGWVKVLNHTLCPQTN